MDIHTVTASGIRMKLLTRTISVVLENGGTTMPDRENVIKGLADISEYARAKADIAGIGKGKEVFDSYYRAVEDAIALLKEQEAVKPKKENDGNPEPCTSWWYVCGDCGRYIDPHDRFCRHCGREVDWND